ncbi:hypothetical protein GLYMA_03G083600v4, partial [Glycine max]
AAITFSKIHSQTLNLIAYRGSLLVSFSAIAVAPIASLGGAKPIVVSEVQREVSSFIEGGQNQENFRLVTVTALGLIGLGPTVSRAFPANAATIVAWELALKMLGIKHD